MKGELPNLPFLDRGRDRRQAAKHQSFPAVEKSALKRVALDEFPDRTNRQAAGPKSPSLTNSPPGLQIGIKLDFGQDRPDVRIGPMPERRCQFAARAL